MTGKDYEMLAALICRRLDASWNTDPVAAMAVESLGIELADELERDNPNFNRVRFFKACNIEAGKSA